MTKEAIERLRASKAKRVQDDIQRGFELGKAWAVRSAEHHQLKTLAEGAEWDESDVDDMAWDEIPNTIVEDPTEFWEQTLGLGWERELSGALQVGFYQGAKAFWDEVEGKV